MNGARHLGISAAGGAILGLALGSAELGAGFFLSGWLTDLDHIPDFVKTWGWREGLRRLLSLGMEKGDPRSVYLPLHSYEWVPLVCLTAWWYPLNLWLLGAVSGYLLHLLIDQASNAPRQLSYFFAYRLLKGFSFAAVFPHLHPPQPSLEVVHDIGAQGRFAARPIKEKAPLQKERGGL